MPQRIIVKLIVSIVISLLSLAFILVFRPGQENPLPLRENLEAGLLYSLATFVVLFCSLVLLQPLVIRGPGTNLKLIMWCAFNLVLLGNANSLVSFCLLGNFATLERYLQVVFGTVATGIVILLLIIFFYQNRLFNKAIRNRAAVMTDAMKEEIEISVGKRQHSFRVKADSLVLVKAMENYVQIQYRDGDGAIRQRIVRTTLQRAEKKIRGCREFLRCHRSFIVNLGKIEKIIRNGGNWMIKLSEIDEIIPINRSMRARFQKISTSLNLPIT